MKAITVLLYRNYFQNLNVLLYRRQQNNFWYRKYNYRTRLKKKQIFNTLPVIRGCRSDNNLLSPFTLYMFELFIWLSPFTLYMFVFSTGFYLSTVNFLENTQAALWLLYRKKLWFIGVWCHFQQYFSYIVAISFIDVGNRRPRRKPQTIANHWLTLSDNVVLSIPPHEQG